MKTVLLFLRNKAFSFLLVLMMFSSVGVWGQISITNTTPLTQNFNGLSANGPVTWTNNITPLSGWYSTTATLNPNNGNTNSNNVYNCGTASNADRALGSLSTTTTHNFGIRLKNNNTADITSLLVSFNGEQWRQNSSTQILVFEYQISSTVTSINTGSWTAVTALDFSSPNTGTAGLLDGNLTANRTAKSALISLSISAGSEIMLRWTKSGTSSHLLAIDDLSITPTFGVSAITSTTSGPWSATSTWVGGVVPNSAADAIIETDHVVTMDVTTDGINTRNIGVSTTVKVGGTLATAVDYVNNGTTTINGTFQLNAGGYASGNSLKYAATGSTLVFNTGSVYDINMGQAFWPITLSPYNVTINSGSGANVNVAIGNIPENGTLSLFGGLNLVNNSVTIDGILLINSAGYINNQSPTYGANSLLKYNTNNTALDAYKRGFEWKTTSGAGYPANVQVSGNTFIDYPNTVGPFNTNLGIAKNLTIDIGSGLYMDYGEANNRSGSLTVGGDVIVNGNLSLGNANGGDLIIGGNWTKGIQTFSPNTRAVLFRGTSAQTITGATTFDYLTINNAAGVTLANSIVNNLTLDFANGKLTLGANDLTIASGGSITNATAAKYIVTNGLGQLKRTVGSSNVIFPVGKSAYNPITFTNLGTSDVYGVRVDDTTPAGANPTKAVSRRWYTTEAVAGGSNLAVVAQYNTVETGAGFGAATDYFIGHYNGTTYSEQVASTFAGTNPFTVSSNTNLTPSDLTSGTQYFAVGRDNAFISVPTKYVITTINPNPSGQGYPVSVTVQSQDTYGSATNVTANSIFTLSSNGNAGTLGGTVTGTIPSGSNSIVVSGLIFNGFGTGVTLTATNTAGLSLNPGTSAAFTVLEKATKLNFGTAPPATGIVNTNLTSFTVQARRTDNSVDAFYTGSIIIAKASGSGTLTGTLTATAVAGIATFNTYQFNAADTYTIVASATGLTAVTSGNIVISPNPANAYFRSKAATGNWNVAGSWESSVDGNTGWVTATVAPSSSANTITIRNGHTITIKSNVTLDQLIIASGGQLTVDINDGKLTLNNGIDTDIDIQAGAVFQILATSTASNITYSDKIQINLNANIIVSGKILIGDGSSFMGGGYGEFGFAPASQITWNHNAILEWNTTGSAPGFNDVIYFQSANSTTIPILRITKINGGNVGGGNPTTMNGVFHLNNTNVQWQGASTKTFRNGIIATGNATMSKSTGNGAWQIGDATVGTAELGGVGGNLTLDNYSVLITTTCSVILTSNVVLNVGSFENKGSLDLGTNILSGTSKFSTALNSTLITANTGGLVAAVSTTGTQTFSAGANYVFNGSTTTPFPTITFGNPASLTFNNAEVVSNRGAMTVSGPVNINGTSKFSLMDSTGNNLTLGGLMTIDPLATFDNNGENQIISGGGSIVVNGRFITRDAQGFTGTNAAVPSIIPTLGINATVEYGSTGNQLITAFAYKNITFSGSGIKTTSNAIDVDTNSLVKITGTTTVNATYNLASTSSNNTAFQMDGGRLILRTGGTQPNMEGTYNLTGGVIEYADASAKTIRSPKSYQNIEVTGTAVANSSGHITLNANGSFSVENGGTFTINANAIVGPVGAQTVTVKDGGTFKTGDANGFNGATTTSVRNDIETIVLLPTSTVEYSGTNQNITKIKYGNLKISNTSGIKTFVDGLIEVDNNLAVAGSLLKIPTDKTMSVRNNVTTIDTDATNGIYIENSGSLVQITDVNNATSNTNVGSINMQRKSQLMIQNDYTYWSSPVQNYILKDISPTTSASKFFKWKEDTQAWFSLPSTSNHIMEAGRGYIIRAPGSYGTAGQTTTAHFIGKPNNGIVTMSVKGSPSDLEVDYKWNLIGNPYPSAIDANTFLSLNSSKVAGTLYFWTHNTPINPSTVLGYAPNDYASWNGTGGTGTTAAATSTPETGNNYNIPTGYIAAGQAFFIRGITDGMSTITFNNSMRVDGSLAAGIGKNSQFFRTATETAENPTTTEKHRVWLNLTGAQNAFNQTLVGYVTDATNAYDLRFDGESFGGNKVTFYSVLDTKNLVIQGRALPFSNLDTVPLGYSTTLTGNLTISIDHVDGLMETQGIYLQDNLLNVVHDLKASSYTFATVPGTFDSRFVLRYSPQEDLSNPTFNDQVKAVKIYKNKTALYANSPYEEIATVSVYDIAGRLIFEERNCNTNRFETTKINAGNQALIIKVTLSNGAVITQKVL